MASSGQQANFSRQPIIILGAGVIGCTIALRLLQSNYNVTLVAEFHPGDKNMFYSSAWAGAVYHPGGGISKEHKSLRVHTYRHLAALARDVPEAGVREVNAREHFREDPGPNSVKWARNLLMDFEELAADQTPDGIHTVLTYKTFVLDPTYYMPYIADRIRSLGGSFVRTKVASLAELYNMYPASSIFINASGIGSKFLRDVLDTNCQMERGQNVFFKTEKVDTYYMENTGITAVPGKQWTYIIPRPLQGGVILGGLKEYESLSPEIDLEIAKDEIARTHLLAPHVVPASPPQDKLDYVLGVRPGRKGGYRIESEKKGHRIVVSAYGFAGAGFVDSYGVAEKVLRMIVDAEVEHYLQPPAVSAKL